MTGAASVTGTGHGSAEGKLRGWTLDKVHHIVATSGRQSAVDKDGRVTLRGNDDIGQIAAPRIQTIDAKNGIVYLDNPSGYQVEVYKYTRRNSGNHVKKDETVLTPRLGKRFRPFWTLKQGVTQWTVPLEFVYPANIGGRSNSGRRNYFKFGVKTPDRTRSDLSSLTICTATDNEYNSGDGIRILYESAGGIGASSVLVE